MRKFLRFTVPAVAAAMALTLAGCGQSTDSTPQAPPTTAATETADGSSEADKAALTLVDGWAKAVDSLDGEHPMTGIFGMLTNTTDADIHLTGGSSPAAGMVELHETVMSGGTMVMREAEGGFVIPAGGTFELKPGGNHIMLMALTATIPAGTDVEATVTAQDGSEYVFTVPARTFSGAEETYAPGHGAPGDDHGDHGGDHGGDHSSDSGTASS